jgi:hypothetical protein
MSCGCGGQSLGKAQRPFRSTGALFVVRLLWGVHSLNIFPSAFGLRAGAASNFFGTFDRLTLTLVSYHLCHVCKTEI